MDAAGSVINQGVTTSTIGSRLSNGIGSTGSTPAPGPLDGCAAQVTGPGIRQVVTLDGTDIGYASSPLT